MAHTAGQKTGVHDPSALLKARCVFVAEEIRSECAAILGRGSNGQASSDNLSGCGGPEVQLLHRQASRLTSLCQTLATSASREAEAGIAKEKRLLVKRLDDIISIAYAKFYAYVYKDLPACWRQLYTDASILKFCLLSVTWPVIRGYHVPAGEETTEFRDATLDEMIRTLDLALILAGAAGATRGRGWIDETFSLLESVWRGLPVLLGDAAPERQCKRRRLSVEELHEDWSDKPSFSVDEAFTPPLQHPVQRIGAMSLERFQAYLDHAGAQQPGSGGLTPLVISGLADDWPARTSQHPWNKPAYLLSRTFDGRRLVPVETGRSYVDDGWGQKLITFGEFLQSYIDPSSPSSRAAPSETRHEKKETTKEDAEEDQKKEKPPIAYLAQHQLFVQLPQLRADVLVPDLCYTSPPLHPTDASQDQPELAAPQLNAWFGPPGTITPLHTDPYHNLLVQVVGRKYVRLYAPGATAGMRARGTEMGVDMGNTSAVDVGVLEGWDVDDREGGDETRDDTRDDEFRKIPFVDCILEPGDTLYIPIGWWHYVRGLSVSFSISFWWN